MARKPIHGMEGTRTYTIWAGMKRRCKQSKDLKKYLRYAGRGITVCSRWEKFENFLEDMGIAPDGLTLERKDNNGNYCKENCTWSSIREQSNNRYNNVRIEFEGVFKTVAEWARYLGLPSSVIRERIKRGDKGNRLFRPLSMAVRLKQKEIK